MERDAGSNANADALLTTATSKGSSRTIWNNFTRMSVCFSLNHGAVTAVLNLAVVLLGAKGSFMNGALYVTYALTALLAAAAITARLGTRGALITGTFTYCIYVLALPLTLVAQAAAWQELIAIVGGGVGGIAAGFLWPAQGAYFAASARLYAEASGISVEQANSLFAARFGMVFLGFELVLKVLPLGIKAIESAIEGGDANRSAAVAPPPMAPPSLPSPLSLGGPDVRTSDIVIACFYSVVAIGAAAGMLTILDLERVRTSDIPSDPLTQAHADRAEGGGAGAATARPKVTLARVGAAITLWGKQPEILLLAPVQAAFGLCAALLGYEITGNIVKLKWPDNKAVAAGILSALVSFVAGALQVPFKKASSSFGKAPVMLTGLVSFTALGALTLFLDETQLAHYVPLISCYVLQGVGRACYEGTNKALYADFFTAEPDAAFANIVITVGTASAIAYFTYPALDKQTMASIALGFSGLAIFTYMAAEVVHRRRQTNPSRLW
jgi:hypothetical protein